MSGTGYDMNTSVYS